MKNQKKFKKNKPLTPPDISDPLFPYGPKNKHLHGVMGVRPETKKRKDVIQTPFYGALEEAEKALNNVISILLEGKEDATTLCIYDFDHTLFKSPLPPEGHKGAWWQDKVSLTDPVVPESPSSNWWINETVSKLEEDLVDPTKYCVLMTGRGSQLHNEVIRLINSKGLKIPEIYTNNMGMDTNTGTFKTRKIKQILAKMPQVRKIEFHDDRIKHLDHFERTFGQQYDIETDYITPDKAQLAEAKAKLNPPPADRYDSPLSLAIFGAPASGKSFMTKQLTKITQEPRINRSLKQGKNIAVDDMRDAFRSKLSPRTQMIMMFEAFFFFKNLARKNPKAYAWWAKKAGENIRKDIAPHLANEGVKVEIDANGTSVRVNGQKTMRGIASVLRKLTFGQVQRVFATMDDYWGFRVVTRYYQYAVLPRQLQRRNDIVFDEVGSDPRRQIDVMRNLHKQGYVTDIIFYHADNVAVNIIQTANRVITGDDGKGRDAGQSTIDSWKEVDSETNIYKRSAEVSLDVDGTDLANAEELKAELDYANTADDEMRGDKPIDLYATISIGTPENAYKKVSARLSHEQRIVFDAFLKSQTYTLNMPVEAKAAILELVGNKVSDEQMMKVLSAAIYSGDYDYSTFAGLSATENKGPLLLKNLSRITGIAIPEVQGKTVSENKKKVGTLTEMPHIFYEPYSEFKEFDEVDAGVLDFSLELLPKEQRIKYTKGFNIEYKGNTYYVDLNNDSIEKIDNDNGKPMFTNWQEYVNIRERNPDNYRKIVITIKKQ